MYYGPLSYNSLTRCYSRNRLRQPFYKKNKKFNSAILAQGDILLIDSTINCVSTCSITANVDRNCSITITNTSDCSGILNVDWSVSASISASSNLAAEANVDRDVSTSIVNTSDCSITSNVDRNCSSSVTVTSNLTAELNVDWSISTEITNASDCTGLAEVDRNYSTTITNTSDCVGLAEVDRNCSTDILVVSTLSGTLDAIIIEVDALISVESVCSGSINIDKSISCVITNSSDFTGLANLHSNLNVLVSSSSVVNGSLNAEWSINSGIDIETELGAVLDVENANIECQISSSTGLSCSLNVISVERPQYQPNYKYDLGYGAFVGGGGPRVVGLNFQFKNHKYYKAKNRKPLTLRYSEKLDRSSFKIIAENVKIVDRPVGIKLEEIDI